MSNYVITSIRDGWMHFPTTPVIYTDRDEALARAAEVRADFPRAQVKVFALVDAEDEPDGMVAVEDWVTRGDPRPDQQSYVARYHEALERHRQQRAREQSGDTNR